MKRIILISLSLLILFSSFASAQFVIDENITSTPLTKGVEYSRIRRLTDMGWDDIHIIKADMKVPGISFKVLADRELAKKATVKEFAENYPDIIGAVNADFFTNYTSGSSSEGMIIKDGELLTTPSNDSSYATAGLNADGIFAEYFTYSVTVESETNGAKADIYFYNKLGPIEYLKVYDSNFGKLSPGSMDDGYEVVVEDGVVIGVYSNKAGVEIPENGYVLSNSLRKSLFLAENFKVGDKVSLNISVTPEIDGIEEAVGGGTILVKNGKKTKFTLKDSINPQTALGYDSKNKFIYLVNVEGRVEKGRGMNFSEVADMLISYGCTDGISFDGGGSTAMAIKKPDGEYEHTNGRNYYRPVTNAIGITAEKKNGSLSYITAFTYAESIRLSESIPVYMYAYDEYMNPWDASKGKLSYSADKKGRFVGNVFYPEETGRVKIKVTLDGVSSETEIRVMEDKVKDDYVDKYYKHTEKDGYKIGIFGDNGDYNTLFTQIVTARRNKYAGETDTAIFRQVPLGNIDTEVKSLNKYWQEENEYGAFVCLNNSSPSLVTSDSSQWKKFIEFISGTKKENIFIMMKKPFDSLETEEKGILTDKINDTLNGKNVFIISYGDEYKYTYDDGIRYISMRDLPPFDRENPIETLGMCKFGCFTFNDEGITFEFVPYFSLSY